MLITLIASASLCCFINSWVSIWILLEINTLAFCSIHTLNTNSENNKNNEITMNYLVIQSIASALLLITTLTHNTNSILSSSLIILAVTALIVNTASAPLHQWFINISNNITWSHNSILFTWQNLAPTYLIIFQNNLNVFPFLIFSAIVGAIAMINNTSLNEIFAYSSVFNLSWIFLAILVGLNIFFLFSVIYWISLLFLLNAINDNNSSSIGSTLNSPTQNSITLLIAANLAGLPPLIGFSANWFTFSTALNLNISPLTLFLLIISTVNLYVYLRIISPQTTNNTQPSQIPLNTPNILLTITFFTLNATTLTAILL